jgi:hypothetical protein
MKQIKHKIHALFALVILLVSCSPATNRSDQDQAYSPNIDPANFVTVIDNPYFPLTLGRTWIYEGDGPEGFEHIEVNVTDETREIMGVTVTVVRDTVSINGEVAEDTYDYYAQDKDGNVWYFGEDSKEIANGQVVSTAGSWEAGVDGALPGIIMLADPQVDAEYRQEYYAGEAEDMGKVIETGVSVSLTNVSIENCIKTEDWTPLEPGVMENKTYCPAYGLVLSEGVQGTSGRQELIASGSR